MGEDCCHCPGHEQGLNNGDKPFDPPLPHAFQWLHHVLRLDDRHAREACVHPLLVLYAIVLVLFLLFFCWEDAPWHGSQRIEERYLKFTILLLFLTTLVAWLDSPKDQYLGMHQSIDGLIMTAVLVHLWERHRKRLILPRFAEFRAEGKSSSSPEHRKPSPKASRAIREIDRCTMLLMNNDRLIISDTGVYVLIVCLFIVTAIVQLHSPLIPYWSHYVRVCFWILIVTKVVQNIYSWHRARPVRESLRYRIKEIFSVPNNQNQHTVETVLETLSVGSLLEVLDDDSKRTLCEGALKGGLLTIRSKAILIDGLMKSGVSHNDLHQKFVGRLIKSCNGMELTKLKDLIDGGGGIYNLMKLIHFDMKDDKIRDQIVWHIVSEAQQVRSQTGRPLGVKLLSDVDDTLYCSGGNFPAGCDTSLPKHVVYPGCLELFKALDRAWRDGSSSCNLVFLSARPHIYKNVAEDLSYRLFRELVQEGSMHSMPTLLPGHATEGLEATITYSCRKSQAWRKVGELKFATYQKFMELYREYDFMFFGDNGQGDLLAGQLMAKAQTDRDTQQKSCKGKSPRSLARTPVEDEEEPSLSQGPRLLGVVIHEVIDAEESLALNAPARREEAWFRSLEADGILHHRSYVGAALALHKLNPELLSEEQVGSIARQAAEDLNEARVMYPEWGHRWAVAEDALRADIEKAAAVLKGPSVGQLPPIPSTRAFLMGHSITWHGVASSSEEEEEEEDSDSSED